MASTVQVPNSLRAKLQTVQERQTQIDVAGGLMKSAAGFLAIMMIAMAIDWFITLFNPAMRTVLTGASIMTALCLLSRWTLRPLFASRRLEHVAREVDDAVPDLQERWSTVAEIAGSTDSQQLLGSPALIRQVAREAESLDHLVQPERVVSRIRSKHGRQALGVCLTLLLLLAIVDFQQVAVLAQRFWAPLGDAGLTQVTAATGNAVVARGESLSIEATQRGRQRESADLMMRSDGKVERIELVPDHDTRNVNHNIESVAASFDYRIRSGDGQTAWHRVEVVDRPRLTGVEFTITPPAYTRLDRVSQSTLPRRMRAIEGSQLEVVFHADQPLSKLELKLNGTIQPVTGTPATGYRFSTTLDQRLTLSPILEATHGLTNLHAPRCDIAVYSDRAPVVQVVTPDDEIQVAPNDTIQVEFKAKDDLGIDRAELVVFDANGVNEKTVIDIPLGDNRGSKELQDTVELDLKPLKPKHGDEMMYAVRVFDTRNTTSTSQALSDQMASVSGESGSRPSRKASDSKSNAAGSQKAAASKGRPQAAEGASRPQDKQDAKPSENLASAPQPPDDMTKRNLDAAGQCSSCKPMRLIIDQWAGSYASQAREKLELAIDPRLKQLDAELAAAEQLSDRLIVHLREEQSWDDQQSASLNRSVKHLDQCESVSAQLLKLSIDTPYAFIGLQLSEIVQSHVEPAGQESRTAARADAKSAHLVPALHHIRRARLLLADLTRAYEAQKLNSQLADAMQRIKTMHQLFLENTFAMLGSGKQLLNPKSRKMLELDFDEEFLIRLQELLDKKRDIQAELAKLLAKDPRLLRRFMVRTRLEANTLRDQMTILARRQQTLSGQTDAWVAAGDALPETATKHIAAGQRITAQRIAAGAARLHENFETWVPLDLDPKRDDLASLSNELRTIATLAGALATESEIEKTDDTPSEYSTGQPRPIAQQIYEKLLAVDEKLAGLGEQRHAKLAVHAANRMVEVRDLVTLTSGWMRKADSLANGEFHQAAEVDQHRLTTDTAQLTRKLDNLQSWMAGMPDEVQDAAAKLNRTLHEELIPVQVSVDARFADKQLKAAAKHQQNAVELFATSETLFDEVLDKAIAFIDSQETNAPPMLPQGESQTLDDLLAMLESEAKACESLGIPCRPTNLSIQKDWMTGKPSSGSCSGAALGGALAQTQVSKKDVAKILDRFAGGTKKTPHRVAGEFGKPGKTLGSFPRENLRWNKIQSELEDQLKQVRGNVIPEQYRQAIEQYFEIIVDQREE